MFNFISNCKAVLQSALSVIWLVNIHSVFLHSFVLIGSRTICSKHNLQPITSLLKLLQWLPTALRIESRNFSMICTVCSSRCIQSLCLPSPISFAFWIPAVLDAFLYLECESQGFCPWNLFFWTTPSLPIDPLPIYWFFASHSRFNLKFHFPVSADQIGSFVPARVPDFSFFLPWGHNGKRVDWGLGCRSREDLGLTLQLA